MKRGKKFLRLKLETQNFVIFQVGKFCRENSFVATSFFGGFMIGIAT